MILVGTDQESAGMVNFLVMAGLFVIEAESWPVFHAWVEASTGIPVPESPSVEEIREALVAVAEQQAPWGGS